MHEVDNMAHGDLKVDNFVISDDFGLKLIDFAHSAKLTSSSRSRIGTPNYHAPEVASGDWYSVEKADIFSLGAALFVIVFKDAPFSQNGCCDDEVYWESFPADPDHFFARWECFSEVDPAALDLIAWCFD